MSLPFFNNPGIAGLDELTAAEEAIVASIASLGSAGQSLVVNGAGDGVEWSTPAGGGDVSASANFGTDNVLIRSNGTTKGVQSSGISVNDSNDMSGVNSINVDEISEPSTPASGTVIIYAKAGGALYIKDDTGTETNLTLGSGGTVDVVSNVAQDRILGRTASGSGDSEELTAAQVRSFLNVEDGATADQTGAQIKTAYEAEADTNAYDDAAVSKLAGIEASADVTDEANVIAALDGATLTDIGTPASTDRILIQDASDSNNLKYVEFSEFGGGGGISDGDKGDITVTSSGATWTLDGTAISGKTTATPNQADTILFGDNSDSGNLKKATISNIVGATGDGTIGLGKLASIGARTVIGNSAGITSSPSTLALSGSDNTVITGTTGTDGNLVQWNADGDIVDGPDVLDEDNMASDSASAVPTQQSVKAYVDNNAGISDVVSDTTPQAGGDFDMNGNDLTDVQEIRLDGTPDADHSACGPTTNTFNAGATIAIGEVVYMASDGEWALADADASSSSEKLIGIAMEAGTDGNPMKVALPGAFFRDDTWNWTAGDTLYLSLTAGDLSASVTATGEDDVSRVIGYAVSADVIYIQPQQGVVRAA